jgi:DNA invertase Pin-like site-specific DNA recombinase
VGFRSLQDPIDTTTSSGKLVFQIFGALAEFERNLIRERTLAGLASARARGKMGGRRPKLTAAKLKLLYQLYDGKQHTVKEICGILAISRTALYKYVERRKVAAGPPAGDGT